MPPKLVKKNRRKKQTEETTGLPPKKKLRGVSAGGEQPQPVESPSTTVELTSDAFVLRVEERTRALEANMFDEELFESDAVYRVLHQVPRRDIVDVAKCRFGTEECAKACKYLQEGFMSGPVRKVRLQLGVGMDLLQLFLPFVHYHWGTLRSVDLSCNYLGSDDILTLSRVLSLSHNTQLEMLNLSYNRKVGNSGAVALLAALESNAHIRAVILKGCGIDDNAAPQLSSLLQQRPPPIEEEGGSTSKPNFFLNLNENSIGASGSTILGKGLPHFVSLTIVKQRLKVVLPTKT